MDDKNCSVANYVSINSEKVVIGSCLSCGCTKEKEVMKFKGFNVFPIGKAKLSINNEVLKVDNIGNSGLDGILIEFDYNENPEDNHTIHFNDLSTLKKNKSIFKTATLRRNFFGQVVTSFESFKWYDETKQRTIFGYNSRFLPEKFQIFGKLEGNNVFEINNENLIESNYPIDPNNNPPIGCPWVIIGAVAAVVSAGVAIYEALKTEKRTIIVDNYDANGKLISRTTSVVEDPKPFEIEVNGQKFMVDEFGIKYDEKYPEETGLMDNLTLRTRVVGEMITGYNLSCFEITSIE